MDMRRIRFQRAQEFKINSGVYAGKTIDDIAKTDEGLRYLDNLVGFIGDGQLKRMLEIYLGDKTIQKELKKLR